MSFQLRVIPNICGDRVIIPIPQALIPMVCQHSWSGYSYLLNS